MTATTPRPLTGAQREALDLERHTAVSAGAGSGKTYVLTERFVGALESVRREPRPLRRVVAITFSRKATAEMRARVRTAVGSRLRDAARAGDDELVRFWRGIRDQLHTARIATIDAFCASLLREHPIASGVDPAFEVTEAAEARLLARDAVLAALTHVSKRAGADDEALGALTRLTRRYRRFELSEMLTGLLADRALGAAWIASIDPSPRAIDAGLAETRRALEARFREGLDRIHERVPESVRTALARGAALTGDDKLLPIVRAADDLLRAAASGSTDDGAFVAAGETLIQHQIETGTWRARSFGRTGRKPFWGGAHGIETMRAHAGLVSRVVVEELGWYAPFDEEIERDGLLSECDLALLYTHVERRYRALLGAPRRLDFAGLTLAAGALVSRPAAAARIAAEIDHLLVDEFQDTSIAQWEVLERIVGASVPAEDPTARPRITVFVVGDEKQAIYEFRGGRVEVFRRVVRQLEAWGGRLVVMDDNFRSLPNAIGVVNDAFAEIFRAREGCEYEAAPQPLHPHRSAGDAGSGAVELLLSDPGEVKDVDSLREIEADRIAAHVRDLVEAETIVADPETDVPRPARWADVAVIVFYKRLYANLESAFAAHGVPTRVLGGLGFYQSREVLDATAFLRALTDRRDEIALAALLRSPFGNLSDPVLWKISRAPGRDLDEWLRTAIAPTTPESPERPPLGEMERDAVEMLIARLDCWSARIGRVPTSSLLDDAVRTTGYLAATGALAGGERRIATVEKLLDVVRRFEARHGIRPVELCEWLVLQSEEVHDEGEAAESGRADGVTLMTIHRAKGTEYPIVVVPGLEDGGRVGETLPLRRTHDVQGARVGLKVPVDPARFDPKATDMHRTARFRLLDLALAERRRAEEKRVLYVAMTRARDRLVLSTRTPTSPSTRSAPDSGAGTWTALDRLRTLEPIARAMEEATGATVRLATSTLEVRPPIPVARPDLAPDRGLVTIVDTLLSGAAPVGSAGTDAPRDQLDLFGATGSRPGPAVPAPPGPPLVDPLASPRPAVLPVTALAELASSPARFYARAVLGVDGAATDEPDADAADAAGATPPRRGAVATGAASGAVLGRRVHRRLARLAGAPGTAAGSDDAVDAHVRAFATSARGVESAAATDRHAEVAFVLPTPHDRLDGTIDRLYRAPDGIWTIVDYKTNRIAPGESLAELAVRRGYDVQLLLYGAAAARILELDGAASIRLVIFFTHPGIEGEREVMREVRVDALPGPELVGRVLRSVETALRERGAAAFAEGATEREPFTFDALAAWTGGD